MVEYFHAIEDMYQLTIDCCLKNAYHKQSIERFDVDRYSLQTH